MLESNANNSKGPNEKILSIQKGRELTIAVSDDMRSPTSFMHTAYCQTVCAVVGITEQTRRFHDSSKDCSESELFDSLFRYSSNIIAFSGQRGGGKTSTMLSFAKLLKEGLLLPPQPCGAWPGPQADSFLQGQVKKLEGMTFIPLSPIAPSILGEKQNILAVVLSRLYGYVAEQFANPNSNIPPVQKQKVSQAFQDCLAGLRGAKHMTADLEQEDFAMLQDVSDGMSLRTSFYKLTKAILESFQDGRWTNTYLVLQLDDADSQLKVGYDVLEDIRKYLMLPNVIILTSADFDMLRRVVEQHYRLELSELMRDQDCGELRHDLTKAASKYIDKLIPPSNLICLPKLKSVLMRWGLQLKLRYGGRCDLQAGRVAARSLQTDLLDRIYRKTGIVFVPSSSSYPHDIVPTSLRGIAQLLRLLEEMRDLPAYIPDEKVLSRQLPAAEFLDRLAGYIETEYLPAAEVNLQKFSDYFVQEWVNVRILEPNHREFLARMERSVEDKVQAAMDYLLERYHTGNKKFVLSNDISDLEELIAYLREKECKQGDLALFFAIRMLITLDNHLWVLQQKRTAIYKFREEGQVSAFRPLYFGKGTYLPRKYEVDGNKWIIDEVPVVFFAWSSDILKVSQSGAMDDAGRYKMLSECLVSKTDANGCQFNLFNIVTFYLRLTEVASLFTVIAEDPAGTKRCAAIYKAQETALKIAANWDVWDLMRVFSPTVRPETQTDPDELQLVKIFAAIDMALSENIGINIWDGGLGFKESRDVFECNIIDYSTFWNYIKSKGQHIRRKPVLKPVEPPADVLDELKDIGVKTTQDKSDIEKQE